MAGGGPSRDTVPKRRTAMERIAASAEPGRRTTTSGTRFTMAGQFFHCPNCSRLSLPMTQVNRSAGKAPRQRRQCIGGVARAQSGLDIRDDDAGMTRQCPCIGRAGEKIGQFARALERIARRDEPPHIIKMQLPQRHKAGIEMTLMRRVERPAQKADAQAGGDGAGRPDPAAQSLRPS